MNTTINDIRLTGSLKYIAYLCSRNQNNAFAHRVLEEIEALAGTTACKSVQLVRLKKWAENDFRYSDDNLNSFFERIKAHNNYFPDCKYDIF